MAKSDEVVLYSNFYACPCSYISYSIMPSLLADARCPGCRQKLKLRRMEVVEVLEILRRKEKGVVTERIMPPPVVGSVPVPPPPPPVFNFER